MEGSKTANSFTSSSSSSSSSSLSSISLDLFGGKESLLSESSTSAKSSSESTTGIFSSVFPPASTILGRDSLHSDALGSLRKHDSELPVWNAKHAADSTDKSSDSKSPSVPNTDVSSVYPDQVEDPCFLSSSLYYGGRDLCIDSSNTRSPLTPDTHHRYEQGGEEDDLNSLNIASRGNWWQGSLYY